MLQLSSSATYSTNLLEVLGNILSLRIKELEAFYFILTLLGFYKILSSLKISFFIEKDKED